MPRLPWLGLAIIAILIITISRLLFDLDIGDTNVAVTAGVLFCGMLWMWLRK